MKYVIKFVEEREPYNNTFYSGDHRWTGVERKLATEMSHKAATRLCNRLNGSIKVACVVEKA